MSARWFMNRRLLIAFITNSPTKYRNDHQKWDLACYLVSVQKDTVPLYSPAISTHGLLSQTLVEFRMHSSGFSSSQSRLFRLLTTRSCGEQTDAFITVNATTKRPLLL